MRSKSTMVFRTWLEPGEYKITKIWIGRYDRESVTETREGAVDNRVGYGSLEAASQWVRDCDAMAEAGISAFFMWSTREIPSITISCQHYEDTYCEPSLELGHHMSEIEAALKIVRKLGAVVEARRRTPVGERLRITKEDRSAVRDQTFRNPNDLLAALRDMRDLVEVRLFGNHAWRQVYVPVRPLLAPSPPPAWDTLDDSRRACGSSA